MRREECNHGGMNSLPDARISISDEEGGNESLAA